MLYPVNELYVKALPGAFTQVFPEAGYQELFDAVKSSTIAGGPTFHQATYEVEDNPFQAIFGGWQVRGPGDND